MKKQFNNLYVHVPFCDSKCAYCAFYSEPDSTEELQKRYVNRLAEKFKLHSAECDELDTVFIGGGTPSLLSIYELDRLFRHISGNFELAYDVEITMECNPETISSQKACLMSTFVNRVSIGAQSFKEKYRKVLGREGDISSIETAISLLRINGLRNIGLDLIYAIPGQTLEDWKSDLQYAVELGVEHISAYSLTVEEGTRLSDTGESVDDELSAEMWQTAGEFLQKHGFSRYEISNYAKEGFQCRHNQNVWHGQPYLGCGPAACSFNGEKRWSQLADINEWLAGTAPELDIIPENERNSEILIMGLRTSKGWNLSDFQKLTGEDFSKWEDSFERLTGDGLIEISDENICPTQKGMLFWDSIAEELL